MKIIGYIILFIVLISGCSLHKLSHTNHPPEIPSNLTTEFGSIDVEIDSLKLNWECTDEDSKPVFTLYLSQDPIIDSLDIVSESIIENSYVLNDLKHEQEYFWKIRVFDGKNTVESKVMKFTTKPFYPDWWGRQGNAEYLYSFGTGVDSSQIESQNLAKENEKIKELVQNYADSLMKLYIAEAIVSDPISLKMSDQVVNIVSNHEFTNSFLTRQETMIIPKNNYRSYIRLNIPKSEIREVLLKKVKSASKLYNELIYSASFQKLQKEFE